MVCLWAGGRLCSKHAAELRAPQSSRQYSIFKSFVDQVKSEVESNPELKKSVDQLKRQSEDVLSRTRTASEGLQKAASASAEAARATSERLRQQASQAASALHGHVAQASEEVRKGVGSFRGAPAAESDAASPAGPSAPAGAPGAVTAPGADAAADAAASAAPAEGAAEPAGAASGEPAATSGAESGTATGQAAGGAGEPGSSGGAAGGAGAGAKTGAEEESTSGGGGSAGAGAGGAGGWRFWRRGGGGGGGASAGAQAPGIVARLRGAVEVVQREVAAAVLPQAPTVSATRAPPEHVKPPADAAPAGSAITVVPRRENRWQKQWQDMRSQLGQHPLFQRLASLGEHRVFAKGKEVADDLRERWETSDSPLVQRIQDARDLMFTETEMGQALREIRARDPIFDMVGFLRMLRTDVPLVIRAYLEGNRTLLKEHCAPEMLERLSGLISAQQAQGIFPDPTILDTSDVELVDLKFLEDDPVVVVQFTCQQLNCSRDQFGNVVEGAADDVQRVYYYWALQQDAAGFVGADGRVYPPRWQLREMMVRGMHNLL